MAVYNSKHALTFDQLSEEVSALTNGNLLFDFPSEPTPIDQVTYSFLQVERPTIRYTAFTTSHELTLYSERYSPGSHWGSQHITLMITALDSQSLCFNGCWLEQNQVALISSRSHTPFALFIPKNTIVVLSEITSSSHRLKAFSDSLIPIKVSKGDLDKFKAISQRIYEKPTDKEGHGGTKAILELVTDLLDKLPPLRPQALHGPSRKSRKHLMTKIVRLMEGRTAQSIPLNQIANDLDISTKSINLFFKEYLFIAPKRFHLLLNLFEFRKVLTQGKCKSVLEATVLTGIDGWSRYSERYQKLFGEKPYDTLVK